MHLRKHFLKTFLWSAGLTLLSDFGAQAIERSCYAGYRVSVSGVSKSLDTAKFQTRRGCGSSAPNRCRRRARDQAHLCLIDFWNSPTLQPVSCQGKAVLNFGSFFHGINTPGGSRRLKNLASIYANNLDKSNKGSKNYTVYAISSGDKGCNKLLCTVHIIIN